MTPIFLSIGVPLSPPMVGRPGRVDHVEPRGSPSSVACSDNIILSPAGRVGARPASVRTPALGVAGATLPLNPMTERFCA